MQETANGQTTNFMMDYNTGLTQVLNDGTNNYIYGNGRIAQVSTGTEYFLGDALGSVRQLTNDSGAITYASAYDPYGGVTSAYGDSGSAYGYTGEYTENEMVYLRARHYAPYLNQFIQPDTIVPDPRIPADWNKYTYVRNNPINYTDPSGYISEEPAERKRAELILAKLSTIYDVHIKRDWGYMNEFIHYPNMYIDPSNTLVNCQWVPGNWRTVDELEYILEAVKSMSRVMGGPSKFRSAMQSVRITRLNIDEWLGEQVTPHTLPIIDIVYTNYGFSNKDYIIYITIHEFGHVWDIRSGFRLSSEMSRIVGTYYCDPYGGWPCYYDVSKGQEPPPGNPNLYKNYAGTNAREDWAESFATYVDPNYYLADPNNLRLLPIRKQYVQDQIQSIH